MRIGLIVRKLQPIFEIQDGTLPVQSPLWERNSWFVTSNQKSKFCGVISTFKGSLLWRALMLKRFPLQIGSSPKTDRNFGVFWAGDPLKVIWRLQTPKRHVYETEHVVWAIKRANRFRIATCRRDEETEKKGRTFFHKSVIFHHCVEAIPVNRSQPKLACL